MDEGFSPRIERTKPPLDHAAIHRQIRRLLQANQRATARYHITFAGAANSAGFHLAVAVDPAFEWATLSQVAYALQTNLVDWSDQKLWHAYIRLPRRRQFSHPEGPARDPPDPAAARRARQLPALRARNRNRNTGI